MLPLVQSSCSRWVAEEDIISAQMKAGCLGQLESVSKRLRALTRGPVRNASQYNSLRGLKIQPSVFGPVGADVFRLISDHHIQRGPSFPKPIDIFIDAVTGKVTSHTQDGKIREDHLDLPSDISNGLPPNLLLNILPSTPETRLSFVAPTTRPRLISISIKPAGEVPFSVGGTSRKALDYVLHVELGGLAGVIAPIIGKQPADFHIWILEGAAPGFIREEGQLYEGGPMWRIEQISPTFPR
jgi:hypothetical protein